VVWIFLTSGLLYSSNHLATIYEPLCFICIQGLESLPWMLIEYREKEQHKYGPNTVGVLSCSVSWI